MHAKKYINLRLQLVGPVVFVSILEVPRAIVDSSPMLVSFVFRCVRYRIVRHRRRKNSVELDANVSVVRQHECRIRVEWPINVPSTDHIHPSNESLNLRLSFHSTHFDSFENDAKRG